MDWTQTLTIIGINIALFIYLSNRMESLKTELKSDMRDFKSDVNQRLGDINQRLASVEVENKEISNRLSSIEGYLMPRKVFSFEEPQNKDKPKEN